MGHFKEVKLPSAPSLFNKVSGEDVSENWSPEAPLFDCLAGLKVFPGVVSSS